MDIEYEISASGMALESPEDLLFILFNENKLIKNKLYLYP